MKPAVADYRYKIYCVRILPLWGDAIYLTDYAHDLTMNGHVYQSDGGYQFTGQASEANMAPGVIDLSGICDLAGIGYNQIVSGVFDNARVHFFATTWLNPVEDEEPLGVAFMGKSTLHDTRYTAELMMMIDALNQTAGKTYTPSCTKRFGGHEYAGCKVDLGPLTVTGTLTGVTSQSVFTDSARGEENDWFGEGTIAFTSGQNAGLKPIEIKSFAAGVITTHEAFHYPVVIGDDYTMIPGCRRRLTDCHGKFNNIVNYGGYPHVPTQNDYTKYGTQ